MNDNPRPLLAGIEAGGTKYVCAVAHEPDELLREVRFPTTNPEETIARAIEFFREVVDELGPIRAMGVGTFGPADVNPCSPGYGGILTTPKEGWAGFNVVNALRQGIGDPVPVAIDTDVNAAAIGEAEFGAGRNCRTICYVTVGTGIGGGLLIEGHPLHGRMHPEIGHITVPDFDEPGEAVSACPFHGRCLEGRASGPAIEKRWNQPADELPDDHPAWDLESSYLAAGAVSLTAAWSPDVIILGGGVMQKPGLIEKCRLELEVQAGHYWTLPPLDHYLRLPELGQNAGIVGALAMARRLL
jgi:fructokinase